MLVVSSVVGVGIFLTPGTVAAELRDGRLFLLAWLAGGLLSLAGALANAELGAMFPRAGGDYVYVSEAYHPLVGFLVGWLSFFVVYAGTIATLAAGFAEGLVPFLAFTGELPRVAIALALIALTSWVNYRGVRSGASFNNVTAALKIATLGALAVVGWFLVPPAALTPAGAAVTPPAGGVGFAAFGVALSPVLFTYLGWNAPVYVASEIRDPGRNVPRSLFLGLGLCTLAYLALNVVYLYALPLATMRAEPNAGAATAFALFGPVAGAVMSDSV